MYLKSLEMQGFKSFADKTVIKFEDGITAVVGPNGSGKSNISDAIRWVLGEQSVKSLRGSKMEDIIFSGTTDRKSHSFAEVTMTFDNSDGALSIDYREVAITRRMFRTGESEYYINRNGCRRKDIKELFMDTGVGKDGYSIIGQGRIDDILSSKSEERRNIFEEAAGIVKYKSRKEESERKLSRTRENLIRIDDISSELEKQIKPLKKQSQNAQKYIDLKEKFVDVDIELFKNEFESLKHDQTSFNNSISKTDEIIRDQKKTEEDLDLRRRNILNKLDDLEEIIKNDNEKKYRLIGEKEKLEGEKKLLEERIKNLELSIEKSKEERSNLEGNIKKQKQTLLEEEQRFNASNSKIEEKKNMLEEEQKTLDRDKEELEALSKSIEDKKDLILEVLNEISEKKLKLNSLKSYTENLNSRKLQIQEEIEDLKKEKADISSQNTEDSKLIEKYESDISQVKEKIGLNDKKRSDLLSSKESTEKKIESLRRDYSSKSSNLKFLEEMKEEYEGYYRGVKNFLLETKGKESYERGIDGVVAEIISVDKAYEKSIEVSLGGALQNIVVENRNYAKKCIELLKSKKLGRITFLPRDSVKSRSLNSADRKLLEEEGVVGRASDLISYEEKYRGIIENLLGRVLIVDNMDTMIGISKKFGSNIKMVTLEGDVLNPGGSMTGGNYKGNSLSLLGRERQIKEIYEDISQKKGEYKRISSELEGIQEDLAIQEQERKNLDEKYNVLQLEKNSIENKYSYKVENENNLDKRISNLDGEKIQIEEEKTKNDQKILGAEKTIEERQEEVRELELKVKSQTHIYSEKRDKYQRQSEELTEYKIENASLIESYKNMKSEISRLKEEIENNEKRYRQLESEIGSLYKSIDESKNKKIGIEDHISNKRTQVTEMSKYLDNHMEESKGYNTELKGIEKNIEETDGKLELSRSKLMEEKLKLEKINIRLENLRSHIWEEYELSYAQVAERDFSNRTIEELRSEHSLLKSEIRSIGSVNLDSIEEYESVVERYEFLSGQRDDLVEAEKSLKQVIRDMDKKMKEQFKVKFEEIRENFKLVFVELFGGGTADIRLEDPDDILNTGIEVVAQPPGKKLQSLSLLSGGEKALTAIAILFSILKTRTTPFCVLDEIEAALDEANVYRYAEYLKSFAVETQFIVITHRKGTMESADSLYGITMEESGISKMLSIKLENE